MSNPIHCPNCEADITDHVRSTIAAQAGASGRGACKQRDPKLISKVQKARWRKWRASLFHLAHPKRPEMGLCGKKINAHVPAGTQPVCKKCLSIQKRETQGVPFEKGKNHHG